jgi:hypothetical protein
MPGALARKKLGIEGKPYVVSWRPGKLLGGCENKELFGGGREVVMSSVCKALNALHAVNANADADAPWLAGWLERENQNQLSTAPRLRGK